MSVKDLSQSEFSPYIFAQEVKCFEKLQIKLT